MYAWYRSTSLLFCPLYWPEIFQHIKSILCIENSAVNQVIILNKSVMS